ncbi:hypothetical protein D9M68_936980 [compost metagenome]
MNPMGVFSDGEIGFVDESPNHRPWLYAKRFEVLLVAHDHAPIEVPDGYGVGHGIDRFTQQLQFTLPCLVQVRRRGTCLCRFDVCHQSGMPGSIDELQE